MTDRLLDLTVWLLRQPPLWMMSGFAWALAWLWWWILPVRKRVALDNLSRALPDLPPRRRGPLLRRMFHGIVLGYLELDRLSRDPVRYRDMVQMEGAELLLERTRKGLPCLCLGGHFGSWDLVLLSFGLVPDLHLTCIVRPPTHPWSARWIERARLSLGVGLLPPRGCKDRVYALLEGGNTVLLPFDQKQRDGILSPFFGRPAPTMPAPAAFARRSRVPVFFLTQWREGVGRHRLRFTGPIPLEWTGDREADIARVTAQFNQIYEEAVRSRPEAWFWLHRRWG